MSTFSDHPAAGDTAAVVVLPAKAGVLHRLDSIEWSYDADPAGGNLQVEDDSTILWQIDVTTGGPGFFRFDNGLAARRDNAMTITLAAGGAGVKGKLNVETR